MIKHVGVGIASLAALGALALWHFPVILPASAAAAVSPDIAHRMGEAALAAERPKRAEWLARQSLRFNPLEVKNLGLLALAQEKEGNRRSAGTIMSLAAAYSWRDEPIQRWLLTAAINTGAYQEMILRADALARRSRGQDMSLSALYLAALTDETAPLVADRLAAAPPYRESFFTLSRQLDATRFDAFEHFITLLAERGSPLSDAEMLPFVQRLIAEADIERAERVWFRGHRDAAKTGVLRDSAFTRFDPVATKNDPFGWVRPSDEAPVEFFVGSPDGTSEEVALNIRSNELGPIELFSQIVRLPMARYDLILDRKLEEGKADALVWQLSCLANGRSFKPIRTKMHESKGWEQVTYRFQLAGCDAYRLSAFLDNPSAHSQSIWIKEPRLRAITQGGES